MPHRRSTGDRRGIDPIEAAVAICRRLDALGIVGATVAVVPFEFEFLLGPPVLLQPAQGVRR
jgi:hypothetical protein